MARLITKREKKCTHTQKGRNKKQKRNNQKRPKTGPSLERLEVSEANDLDLDLLAFLVAAKGENALKQRVIVFDKHL